MSGTSGPSSHYTADASAGRSGGNQQGGNPLSNVGGSNTILHHQDHFPREVLQRVVADTCRFTGFHAIKSSASDVMVDLLQSFIQNIATSSKVYTTHCGRTESNVFDVERALKHHMDVDINDLLSFFYVLQDKSQDDQIDLSTFDFGRFSSTIGC